MHIMLTDAGGTHNELDRCAPKDVNLRVQPTRQLVPQPLLALEQMDPDPLCHGNTQGRRLRRNEIRGEGGCIGGAGHAIAN